MGEAIITDRVSFSNQQINAIVPKEGYDPSYLYYSFRLRKQELLSLGSTAGARTPILNKSAFCNLKIRVPSLPLQRRIASILGDYDDLIEVNRLRIALLEEMARRLFEEWFVRFRFPGHEDHAMVKTPKGLLPEGWQSGVLGDVVEQRRDTTSPGEHLSARVYVPIECIGRKTLALSETRPWHEAQSSLQLFEREDILFGAMRAYFHKVAPAPMAGITRSTCFVLRARSPLFFTFATLALFRDETVAFAAANSKGSTIPYAQWAGSLERMPIVIPKLELLKRFEDLVRPMLGMIMNLREASGQLAASRDLILPRLISGELSLPSTERELEAVA